MTGSTVRSSRSQMFFKTGVRKNFAKFTGKHLCQSLYFNKVAGLKRLQWLLLYSNSGNAEYVIYCMT